MSENSKAIVQFDPNAGFIFSDIDGMFRAADCYIQSGLLPESYKTPQQLVIVWSRAAELGLKPGQAIDGMTIINRRVGIMGDLALALVRNTGLLEGSPKVEHTGEGDTLGCKVTVQRKGSDPRSASFSVKEAKQAGIYQRVWPLYPKRMTYYRALGFVLRDEFSDVLKGLYIAEELEDLARQEDAEKAKADIKFVDVDSQQAQMNQQGISGTEIPGARYTQEQKPPPTVDEDEYFKSRPAGGFAEQLKRDFPAEAKEAEKKFTRPSTPSSPQPEPTQPSASQPLPTATADRPGLGIAQVPDDLDMGPSAVIDTPTQPPEKPSWYYHEIKGVRSFAGRAVGDLTPAEMQLIESKWIPAAHLQISKATQEQLDDLKAFEARIEHDKSARPW